MSNPPNSKPDGQHVCPPHPCDLHQCNYSTVSIPLSVDTGSKGNRHGTIKEEPQVANWLQRAFFSTPFVLVCLVYVLDFGWENLTVSHSLRVVTPWRESRPLPHGSQCVSLLYGKPAKTGSDTVRMTLSDAYKKAKFVQCQGTDEFTSLNDTKSEESANFDGLLCHNIWDAETMSVIASQARFPLIKINTIRDPVSQYTSLYWFLIRHDHSRKCGAGRNATLEEVKEFTQDGYYPRIPSFYSREYTIDQLSRSLAWEECASWDILWRTETLKEVLKTDVQFHEQDSHNDCPEKEAFLENKDIMEHILEATAPAREMYNEMLKCSKVVYDSPFHWDTDLDCFVMDS